MLTDPRPAENDPLRGRIREDGLRWSPPPYLGPPKQGGSHRRLTFKAINDRFGHPAGDTVLRSLVQACQSALRPIDMVVRWGGQEFLVVLPDTDAVAAMSAAERVRVALAATEVVVPDIATIRFTVSIGVAVSQGENPGELLRRSDVALYAAKNSGRDRVVLAP